MANLKRSTDIKKAQVSPELLKYLKISKESPGLLSNDLSISADIAWFDDRGPIDEYLRIKEGTRYYDDFFWSDAYGLIGLLPLTFCNADIPEYIQDAKIVLDSLKTKPKQKAIKTAKNLGFHDDFEKYGKQFKQQLVDFVAILETELKTYHEILDENPEMGQYDIEWAYETDNIHGI